MFIKHIKNRYGRGYTKDVGFAIVNGTTKPGAYIVKYDAYSLEQLKVVKLSPKPVTAFTLSQDGAVLAIASADLSLVLLDATTLKVLTKVKDAHSFSITSVAVSPDRRLLASASADNTIRIVCLPLQFNRGLAINPLYTLLLALLVSGLLLWITTVVDLDPYFKAKSDALLATTTPKNVIPFSTLTETSGETVVDQIIAETPAQTIVDQISVESPIVIIGNDKDEL